MPRFITAIWLGLVISAQAFCATIDSDGSIYFNVSFEKGINLRDNVVRIGEGYAGGDSYNVDFLPDGSAKKRPGVRIDSALAGDGTSVNILCPFNGYTREMFPQSQTLAAVGTAWKRRTNEGNFVGTWESAGASVGALTGDDDLLSAVEYGGWLVGGGESSSLWWFDGAQVARQIMFPSYVEIVATATAGGSLDSNTTYYYAMAFQDSRGCISPLCRSDTATTTGTNRTVFLTSLDTSPPYLTGRSDTSSIVRRLIYRSEDGADYYFLDDTEGSIIKTYTDDGSLSVDLNTTCTQDSVGDEGMHLSTYGDFLWYSGGNGFHRTDYALVSEGGHPGFDRVFTVSGAGHYAVESFSGIYDAMGIGYTLTAVGTNRTRVVFKQSAFPSIPLNTTAADYLVFHVVDDCPVGEDQPACQATIAPIVAVLNDSTVEVDLAVADFPSSSPGPVAIRNNVFRIDDEIVGVAYYQASGANDQWYASGPIDGSECPHPVDHAAGTSLEALLPLGSGRTLYYSDNVNTSASTGPLRKNTFGVVGASDEGNITGLVGTQDILYVFLERSTYGLVGTDPSSFRVLRLTARGSSSPASIQNYSTGALFLSDDGVYFLSAGADAQSVSDVLGTAVKDSAYSGTYVKASGFVYDDHYYLTVPSDANNNCLTWILDLETGAWSKYHDWHSHVMGSWSEESDPSPDLFLGGWKSGTVYEVDEDLYTDEWTDGVTSDITCAVTTPAFNYLGRDLEFNEVVVGIDNGDDVTIQAVVTGTSRSSTFTIKTLDASAGDTSLVPGTPRYWRLNPNVAAQTLKLIITSTGDSRFTVVPGHVRARPRR